MTVSFSTAADSCAEGLTEVFAAGVAARGVAETLPPETSPETEAAGPLADRLASPVPERRVGGEAVAPVAARVGVGTAWPAAAFLPFGATADTVDTVDTAVAVFAACADPAAPVAAPDAFVLLVLLVVTAVILAL